MNVRRVMAMVTKETREILRDPITFGIALVLPVVMLFLFGYAVSLDVENVALGVLDLDKTPASRMLVDRFVNSGHFVLEQSLQSEHELERAMQRGDIRIALVIPPGFLEKTVRNERVPLQVVIDGTHSATGLIVGNYARAIVAAASEGAQPTVRLETRVWYNPGLRSINYFVPGLYGVLLMSFPPLLTALGIVREKETGSVQQIFVSPLRPSEFILGKLIPYGFIAFIEIILVFGVGALWFAVPVRGSIAFLLVASLLYVFCTVGIGLLISTITRSQLAAMLAALMITLMPSYLFSGFLFPIFTMPFVVQLFTHIFPTRYFVELSRAVVLKGAGFEYLWANVLIILVYTIAVFLLAARRFRKKVA